MSPVHTPAPSQVRHPAPENGAVRLGDAWFRVRSFETRRPGEPASAPPRTVGHVCLQLGGGRLTAGAAQAAEVCLRMAAPAPSELSARDKVVLCGPQGETFVYQADRARGTAALCACGNASGASAALLAGFLGRARVRQDLFLPDGRVGMTAGVTDAGEVEQSWVGVRFAARAQRLLGRDVAVCTGTLNDYLVVRLADAAGFDAFGLDDAGAFWEQGRQRFGFDDPLRARLAALACDGPVPRAKFFTCGRAHPGAPLTGLAVLALLARQLPRLAPLAAPGRVEHPRGADALPLVRDTAEGTAIDLSPIQALLRPA
jgi:hypothetical protein